MQRTRRAVRVLSATVAAGSMFCQSAASATQTVTITGARMGGYTCCYYGGFDGWMTSFFGNSTMSDLGFSVPESEAYAFNFGQWITNWFIPKAQMSLNVCNPDPRITASSRGITKYSEDLERLAAANQIMSATIPNFVNLKKDGLTVQVTFGDSTKEAYRHTTFGGWQAVPGSLSPGNGVAGSACRA